MNRGIKAGVQYIQGGLSELVKAKRWFGRVKLIGTPRDCGEPFTVKSYQLNFPKRNSKTTNTTYEGNR